MATTSLPPMGHIVRTLVQWIVLLVGCQIAMVVAWFFSSPVDDPLAVGGSLMFGAFTTWFGVQFGRASLKRWRERAALARADDAGRPRDGEFVIARGTLLTNEPLVTPFSGRPAVAYGYKAWRYEPRGPRNRTQAVEYWWGEGSSPCALLTRNGALEVRSRPWLEMSEVEVENTPAARAAFDAFLRSGQPQVFTGGVIRSGFDWNAPLDGALRRDHTRAEAPPPVAELTFTEWAIAPSEPVVLIGRYSEARGGLMHDDRRGRALRALKGDADGVRAQLRTGALGYGLLSLVAFGLTFLVAGSGLGWHDIPF